MNKRSFVFYFLNHITFKLKKINKYYRVNINLKLTPKLVEETG